jgi:hypothetical protein
MKRGLDIKEGEFYTGKLTEGKRSGKGLMRYDNNEIYFGEWSGDKPHGRGILFNRKG